MIYMHQPGHGRKNHKDNTRIIKAASDNNYIHTAMNVSTEATSENDNNARMDRMRGPSNSENRTANNNGGAFMNSAVANNNVNVDELNNNIHVNPFLFSIDPSRLLEMERCVRLTQKKFDQMTERLSKCMKYVALLK